VKSRWVFSIKPDGTYKARFVAKGYSQRHGIDYQDVYAPVLVKESMRVLLTIAVERDWEIFQGDVTTAFLYGELEKPVYVHPPFGSCENRKLVWKLKKSLYGL
jgi:hypothetical protein